MTVIAAAAVLVGEVLFVAWTLRQAVTETRRTRNAAEIDRIHGGITLATLPAIPPPWMDPTAEVTRPFVPRDEIATHHAGIPARDLIARLVAERTLIRPMLQLEAA